MLPMAQAGQKVAGIGRHPRFIPENEATSSGPAAQQLEERSQRVDNGHIQPLALLGGFDGNGGKPFLVDAIGNGELREHRADACHAQLGGFFDDPFGLAALERGAQKPYVGCRLPAGAAVFPPPVSADFLPADCKAACHSPSRPLKSATLSPGFLAQHLRQVMGLLALKRNVRARGKRLLNIKPGAGIGGVGSHVGE